MKEKLHKLKARILGSRALLGLTVFAGFMLVATLVVATAPSPQPQERLEKAWPVSITVAEPGSMTPTLVTFGKVESRQVANLKTSITAPVDKLLVAEGEWVNEGQPLIALEQRELKLALTMADGISASYCSAGVSEDRL